jgi:4-amino-4-deoxy-L-arabinose transferase-like glycosyltransferase
MVRAFAAAETAFFAALILGLSVLLMSEAKIAKTDAVLLATVTIAQAMLLRVYAGWGGERLAPLVAQMRDTPPVKNGGRNSALPVLLVGWGALGLGVLVKGPVIAIVCAATIAALVVADRDWRWLKQLRAGAGIPLVLAMILPWAIAIGFASHGAFYEKSLGQDFALKLVGEQETHGAPPGYYALLANLTFWPGTLLLLPALVVAWRRRTEPAIRFLLAWAAATWLLFELVPTKLPHYVLPAYPAVAALCAIGMKSWADDGRRGLTIARWLSLILFVVAGIAFALFVAMAPAQFGNGVPWWLYIAVFAAMVAIITVIPAALARRPQAAFARAAFAAILVYAIAGFVTAPRLNALWLSPRMAESVARYAQPSDPAVITAGYSEPSIQFLLGTRTVLDDGADAARASARSGGLVLVSDDQRDVFLSGLASAGARAQVLDQIDGLNYSRGRKTRITLYRVVPRAG